MAERKVSPICNEGEIVRFEAQEYGVIVDIDSKNYWQVTADCPPDAESKQLEQAANILRVVNNIWKNDVLDRKIRKPAKVIIHGESIVEAVRDIVGDKNCGLDEENDGVLLLKTERVYKDYEVRTKIRNIISRQQRALFVGNS